MHRKKGAKNRHTVKVNVRTKKRVKKIHLPRSKSRSKAKKKLLKPQKKPISVKIPRDKKKSAFLRKANSLLERSKKRGFVTYGEILK